MRFVPPLTAALMLLGTTAVQPIEAAAATPPRVSGQSCASLAGTSGLWRASYWAQTTDLFGNTRSFMLTPCFTSAAACRAWFYWAQSDWPDEIAAEPCRQVG